MRDTQGTYQGRPCRACGGTERYRSTRNCTACQRTRYAGRRTDYAGMVTEANAVRRNSYLALHYPAELDRLGWRMVGHKVAYE